MTQTTLTKKQAAFKKVRTKFSLDFEKISDHSEIPEDLCLDFVNDLVTDGVQYSAPILVEDSTPNLCLHLKEAGFTNLTYHYNGEVGSETTWVPTVVGFCSNQKIRTLSFNSNTVDMTEYSATIGNPPFQDPNHGSKSNSMWKKFLTLAMDKSDFVSLVLPSSVLTPAMFPKIKDTVTKIDLDVKKYFPGVGSSFCRITLVKNTDAEQIKINTPTEELLFTRSSTNFVPRELNQSISDQMEEFLTGERSWHRGFEYEARKPVFCSDGEFKVLHTKSHGVKRTNVHHPNNNLIRVSVAISGNPEFKVIENMGLTDCHMWTVFDNREEAEAYAEWGNSEEIQSFLKKLKWGGFNEKAIIEQLR